VFQFFQKCPQTGGMDAIVVGEQDVHEVRIYGGKEICDLRISICDWPIKIANLVGGNGTGIERAYYSMLTGVIT
jgi:hypothetical protein